jgi:hypothetical protein
VREAISRKDSDETIFFPEEAILPNHEEGQTQASERMAILIKPRSSIMWSHYEIVSWSFLVAVAITGLGIFTTLFIG